VGGAVRIGKSINPAKEWPPYFFWEPLQATKTISYNNLLHLLNNNSKHPMNESLIGNISPSKLLDS